MCVNALIRCGVPATDQAVTAGTAYLLSKRDEWVRAGQEIDGAFAMETVLATRGRWREISSELAALLSWVRDREAWTRATQLASESHDESCKVAQIANSLVGIVWDTVKSELPLLLEGIATTIYDPQKIDSNVKDLSSLIYETIGELKSKIIQEINSRQEVAEKFGAESSGEMNRQLSLWRDRKQKIRALEADFENAVHGQETQRNLAVLSDLAKSQLIWPR